MKSFVSLLGKFLLAVITTTVLAVVISSQRVINNVPGKGATSINERLSMSFYDLQHFAPLYGVFILIAFLIAFLVAALLYRRVKFGRIIIYLVAGGTAMWVMLWAMEQVFFGVPVVAGARDFMGLFLQVLSGSIGGLLFALLTRPKKNPA